MKDSNENSEFYMKNLIIDATIDDLPEEIRNMFRESIKKTIKTTFTKDDDGWTIHCEFMGETCLFKQVHDTELEEDEIIEQFYAKYVEPELIDLLLSGQHTIPLDLFIRIVPNP